MIRYSKYHAWFCLFLVSLMTLVQPFAVFADVMTSSNAFVVNPDYLIGSASNADPYGIATMDLTDDDYGISVTSSLANVVNTIDYSSARAWFYCVNSSGGRTDFYVPLDSSGKYSFAVPDGYTCVNLGISLKDCLPVAGTYMMSVDHSSDISFSADYCEIYTRKSFENASPEAFSVHFRDFEQSSGDLYWSDSVEIGSKYAYFQFKVYLDDYLESGSFLAGYWDVNFTRYSGTASYVLAGVGNETSDYQNDVSSSLSDISSSIGDMSSSLDSAAENLEYISTSQNLIIQGIDNVIMHISDQLYAFWDQLYNLIHEPTYARLEQILLALKAIANNSDISAVVDTIEETTQQQIANDNANTGKVESAVEKHGNFIIEGLKSLFIPSDEYFKSYFDDLYAYFSDRFGFLSFPIDLLVRLIDLFVNAADRDCILTLPDFEISGQPLISEASFNLTEFLERDFAILLSSIRLVTSIGLIIAFVHLCQDKWNEVMRN